MDQTHRRDERSPRGPMPRLKPSLFVDPRAPASTQLALEEISKQAAQLEIPLDDVEGLKITLGDISATYWADHKYDHQTSYAQMKVELRPLRRDIQKILGTLSDLSRSTQALLDGRCSRIVGECSSGKTLNKLHAQLTVIETASSRLLASKLSKTRAVATVECCGSLWRLREQLTGRPLCRNWQSARGKTDSEFVAGDARFVQIVMTAINPEIGLPQVRSALIQYARKKMIE